MLPGAGNEKINLHRNAFEAAILFYRISYNMHAGHICNLPMIEFGLSDE